MLKQCHVADFETYVLILYTALQNLLPARYFIPPIAKTGNVLVSCFSVLNGGRAKGNLLPRTFGVLGALVGCLVHFCTLTLVLYVARLVRNRGMIPLCRAFLSSLAKGKMVAVCD